MGTRNFTLKLICLSLLGFTGLGLSACRMYGDPQDAGGIPQTASSSGLARSWASQYGDTLTIAPDGSLSDTLCQIQGTASNINQGRTCPQGESLCGMLILTIKETNGASSCQAPGDFYCSYFTTAIDNQTQLTLNCGKGPTTYLGL